MHDFIGLAVCVINNFFERKILILDITKMPGNSHNAENIKEAIEAMINKGRCPTSMHFLPLFFFIRFFL